MRRAPLSFIIVVSALLTASCGRKSPPSSVERESPSSRASAPPIESVVPPAEQSPRSSPAANFAEMASQIRPAVVIISLFDESGHLSANGHGFFVSDDGKIVADRSVLAGAVNAVAKAANGSIYNISGALAQPPAQNLVLLKADARRVPFLAPSATALPKIGGSVAVVLSPLEHANSLVLEEKISGRFSDEAGEWVDITPALPKTSIGAPVINQRGDVIGIVTFRAGSNSCAIRPAHAASALLAQVPSNMIASWQTPLTPLHSTEATASPTAEARSSTPAKIPLQGSKLVYAPSPHYPAEVKRSRWAVRGSGSFRVLFDANGRAVNVVTVRSTGNPLLDEAAVSALHEWRSQPGRYWSLLVPISFQP